MKILVITSWLTDILSEDSEKGKELAAKYPDFEIRTKDMRSTTQEDICWADIITGHPHPKMLKAAANLKWLHLQSAGVNGYDRREIYGNPDTIVTRAAGVHAVAIAEHSIAMALSLNRLMPQHYKNQRQHEWGLLKAKYEIFGSTALILGTGCLATEIAKRLGSFGCRVHGLRRDISKPAMYFDKVYSTDSLKEAVAEADYIFNTLPLTEATKGIIGRAEFNLMKPRMIIINVGRGDTIDQQALIDALQSGKIYGAGLDVTSPEPLPPDSPLWDMENVIITPHCSAWSDNTDKRRGDCFLIQLEKFVKGEPLDGQIDFDAGY
jgi:phosphoglycerate dehydrogenase-like enzyme